MEKMNVLSLFDGMSGGRQALERAGIKVDNYFASEIDKYAIQVTMANYPDTIQLGSVTELDGYSLPKIDMLIGGSPCQSFSFAGKRKGMSTKCETEILTLDQYLELKNEGFEFEGQSFLFWEYMRLLNEVKPKYFLLENVMMSEKWEKILTQAIGINPIMINSSLVSAQNRKRFYWFGQIRERLFYNDNFCYICRYEERNGGIQNSSQNERSCEVLGEAQRRQIYLQNLRVGIFENSEKRNDKNLFCYLPKEKQKNSRFEQMQNKKEDLSNDLPIKKQREYFRVPEELQENRKRERNIIQNGTKSIKKDSENNEDTHSQRANWTKEEAEQRRFDYHSKYGEDLCCLQCGKRLNHRSYTSFVKGWDKLDRKSPSVMSEMQFNEARQNNGRVFDILEIGIAEEDMFGEVINKIQQPKDKKILLKDILESEVDEKYFLSEKLIAGFQSHKERHDEKADNMIQDFGNKRLNSNLEKHKDKLEDGTLLDSYNQTIHKDKSITISTRVNASSCTHIVVGQLGLKKDFKESDKAQTLLQRDYKGMNNYGINVVVHNLQTRSADRPSLKNNKNAGGSGHLSKSDGKTYCLDTGNTQAVEITGGDFDFDGNFRERPNGKSGTLRARAREDESCSQLASINSRIRRLTPTECERLQTVKDGYTNHVSDSQRYKMLGNGWNIDTIVHIFSYL
jgi:DNA-cytosine methyltransferase